MQKVVSSILLFNFIFSIKTLRSFGLDEFILMEVFHQYKVLAKIPHSFHIIFFLSSFFFVLSRTVPANKHQLLTTIKTRNISNIKYSIPFTIIKSFFNHMFWLDARKLGVHNSTVKQTTPISQKVWNLIEKRAPNQNESLFITVQYATIFKTRQRFHIKYECMNWIVENYFDLRKKLFVRNRNLVKFKNKHE